LSRRALLAGAGVATLAAAGTTLAQDPATPAPDAGTPGASPVASPVGAPSPFGNLTVVRDPQPTYPDPPVAGGELRLMLTAGDNGDFNPAAFAQDYQVMVSYLDPLVRMNEVTLEPEPWLAESWSWSDDGTEITYTLRDDVRWHDDEPLTAQDVAFTFTVYRDDILSSVRNLFTSMRAVDAVDDRTVKVTLNRPDGGWLRNASSQLVIQRRQYVDHWEDRPEGQRSLAAYNWAERKPLGTGPWVVGERGDRKIELSRNDDYWAGPPHADRLTLTWNEDPDRRLRDWRRGSIDLAWPVDGAKLDTVYDVPGTLHLSDSLTVMFAAFNFDNPLRPTPTLLTDLRIREAISLAIDRERYTEEVFGGLFDPTKAGGFPQPSFADPDATNPARDLEAAGALLEEAGFRDAGGYLENDAGDRLGLDVVVRQDADPKLIAVLVLMVEDLAEVGVGLEIRRLSPERFENVWVNEHGFDLIAFSFAQYPGFTDFDLYGSAWDIRTNVQGFNPGGYRNEAVDRAIDEALATVDDETLVEAVRTIQAETTTDLFALWLGRPLEAVLVRPEVAGFAPNLLWQTWDTRKLWRRADPPT
jgi:peptide/nickel transport system substrate-binding protein